jgi:ArsR family transcriptional regulator, arsenate/arsenite/antimonite-responsive transcriptional repressor
MPGVATAGVERNLDQALRWFRALSDETRLRLVDRLRAGEQCVCDLTDALDTSQSRLSFHLKTLRDAGIVTDRREGRWVYYALNPEVIEAMGQLLVDLRPTRTGLRVVSKRCD